MIGTARLLLLLGGATLIIAGLAVLASGEPGAGIGGFWLILSGAILAGVALLERLRYRADAIDRSNPPVGPGGGEPGDALEPRFVPTAEVFRDPTSGRRMRVFVDPTSGERRYLAQD
jgi:hypothetical protein